MARVTATVIAECYDSKSGARYFPGQTVTNFDLDSQLATLKTRMGRWIFQCPERPDGTLRGPLDAKKAQAKADTADAKPAVSQAPSVFNSKSTTTENSK